MSTSQNHPGEVFSYLQIYIYIYYNICCEGVYIYILVFYILLYIYKSLKTIQNLHYLEGKCRGNQISIKNQLLREFGYFVHFQHPGWVQLYVFLSV